MHKEDQRTILRRKLKEINDENRFDFCISAFLKSDEEVAAMLDYIEHGDDVCVKNIILYATYMHNVREGLMEAVND